MGRCFNHEIALDRLRVKVTLTEDELSELKSWKVVQEKKLALLEEARGELEKQTKLLQKVLVDKEKEITKAKDRLSQANEEAIREYRDFDALLAELGGSFIEGFDDCLRQVKASHPDLNLSNINIDAPAQTSIQLVAFESMDELFADDVPGDGEIAHVEDNTRHLDVQEENEQNSLVQQYFFFLKDFWRTMLIILSVIFIHFPLRAFIFLFVYYFA